jgi:hypothetical protein
MARTHCLDRGHRSAAGRACVRGAVAQARRSRWRSRSPVREPPGGDGIHGADCRHGSHPAVCRFAGRPFDRVCRRAVFARLHPVAAVAERRRRSSAARDRRCARAVLVAGQPLDRVLRRPGPAEAGLRVGRQRPDDHQRRIGSSRRLLGPRRHDSVRDRVWRCVSSRGPRWRSTSRDGAELRRGVASLAAVPAGWAALSLHRARPCRPAWCLRGRR